MNSFATMGFNTFTEGVEAGMPPAEAAEAAGAAMGTAATELGFPPDMVADGVASGMAAFNDALADGMSPTDAFGVAVGGISRFVRIWHVQTRHQRTKSILRHLHSLSIVKHDAVQRFEGFHLTARNRRQS